MTTPTIEDRLHVHHHHGDLQPNSKMCFVCGVFNVAGLRVRFYSVDETTCEARVVLTDHYQGYPGIAHGGIVATVLDEIMGRALLGSDQNRLLFTGTMQVKYRLHVPLDTEILFRGKIIKDRGRIAQAEGWAILPDGTVAVEATSTLIGVPQEQLEQMQADDAVGWRVYQDDELPDLPRLG